MLGAFKAKAKELFGERGVSEAACEAFREWLAKRGVTYVDESDTSAETQRLRKLAALAELAVDVDALLDRELERAGAPMLAPVGG